MIAILAVLALLAMPAINSVLTRMKTSQCTHNMRRIASALHQYAADNNGALPGDQWNIPSQNSQNTSGRLQIPDYVNPRSRSLTPWVLRSPFVPRAIADRPPYNGGTYGYNDRLYNRRLASLKKPSESLVVADAIGFTIWGSSASWQRFVGDHQISRHGSQVTTNRNDAAGRNFNALFADGHVKLIRAQDYNPANPNPFPVHWVRVDLQ